MVKPKSSRTQQAFTILELATVIVVIVILATMAIGSYSSIRDRARRAGCSNNLTGLHVAVASYLSDHDWVWPQVSTDSPTDPAFAQAWIGYLKPYKMQPVNWCCPAIQAAIGLDPNLYPRLDYFPTPFDATPRIAFKYATQPWFVERADIHGDGNMLIYASGEIKSLDDVYRDSRVQTLTQ